MSHHAADLTDMERPLKSCREEFITRRECELLQDNINAKVAQIHKDIKSFRNQLAALFGSTVAAATLIISVLQYIESLGH